MSLSDYYLSQGKSITCSTNCRNGWMHISNNAPNSYEWIMARYGLVPDWGLYDVFVANSSGAPTSWHPTSVYAVRPILYLESSVALNGSGTIDDPFIII